MVRRSSDAPRTVPDTISAQAARLDEAARAQGRGSTALRDASGNVLQMNGDAPYPLLRPLGVDASVAFSQDGTVKIVSPDTQQDRDMTVRDIGSSGTVDAPRFRSGATNVDGNGLNTIGVAASGTIGAARFTCGPVNIDFNGIATPGIAAGGTIGAARFTCGTVNIAPAGIATPGLTSGGEVGAVLGTFNDLRYGRLVPWSAERLKYQRKPIEHAAALSAVNEITWDMWRYKPSEDVDDIQAAQQHVGPMADELAEQPLLAGLVVRDDDGEIQGYDLTSLVGVLGKAVADLSAEVADLRRQVDEQPSARYQWEAGWSPWAS